ncbi:MAG: hypothetical protein RMJ53_10690 [Chitinophagales bacterium]|nr:hypothetical protein [Chitinophagales bacterium]
MRFKTFLFTFLVLALFSSCTKERLIKQLTGIYKLDSYIKDKKDLTNAFKAEKQDYRLEIKEENVFTESFKLNGLVFKETKGQWQLINSNKDLQMVDADNNVRIFNIKHASNKKLTLTKGNEEYQFTEE